MSLMEYVTPGRDKFEAEERDSGFAFPCSACKYRHGTDQDEPCRSCDHNSAAKPDHLREAN